jgi:hypothetical protein
MDLLVFTMSLVLGAGVLALILYPLWQQTRPETAMIETPSGQSLEEYQARYRATLDTIRDLMFDYEMGKTSAEDYDQLLAKAKIEAAEIRRQIDRLSHTTNAHLEATLDVEIEKLIAQIRVSRFDSYETLLNQANAEIELLKTIQLDTADLNEMTCPYCVKAYWPGDAFCSSCGQPLTQADIPPIKTNCPVCGATCHLNDAFCAQCGVNLNPQGQSRLEAASR